MGPNSPYRPRVSRETRLLLTAGALAVAALWLLDRVRFKDLPVPPSPIPAVLTQLAMSPRYEDLAAEIAQVQTRLDTSLVALDWPPAGIGMPGTGRRIAALRLRDDIAVALVPTAAIAEDARLLGRDHASGLAVVRVPTAVPAVPPLPWMSRRLQQPRYFIATDVSSTAVSLRPAFVGTLDPLATALWPEAVWVVPDTVDLPPGTFLFTNVGEVVGLVIAHGAARAIVPGATLLAEAERLLERGLAATGSLGVDVQALTESVASITGASAGAVVAWVDPAGAAHERLKVGDVIEAVDGSPLADREWWDVRIARLSAGDTLTLRVRRRGEVRDVAVAAMGSTHPPATESLGLVLRGRSSVGAEVTRVAPGSAGDRAGLVAGDVITLVADVEAPTPAQLTTAFASLRAGQRAMLAVTRGDTHFVTTIDR